MAIQKINLGTEPLGEGGDTYRSANTKINENFSNTTHAASRLVGPSTGQIPLAEQAYKAAHGAMVVAEKGTDANFDVDSMKAGDVMLVAVKGNLNTPPQVLSLYDLYVIFSSQEGRGRVMQTAYGYGAIVGTVFYRNGSIAGGWSNWIPANSSRLAYATTSGTAPNVVVESDGTLKRSSSSAKYKEVITNLELDNDLYQKAMQVNPIIYRSKSEGDPKDWHYMSFLAEEIGELDPSLTQWKTHDYNPETDKVEKLEKKEAEGINLNAICAVLHATNIYQDKKLKELEQRLATLEQLVEPEPEEEPIVDDVEETEVVEEPSEDSK